MSADDVAGTGRRHTIHAVRPDASSRARVGEAGMMLGAKYRLERPIAAGGMAAVWKATHVTLNRPVAVKFIDALQGGDADEHVGRFLREAKVAASVRHKNVVDILDFGVYDRPDGASEPYMIMELLDGEALDQRLERGPMELDEILGVVRQALSGLDAVHARGIVHRDLKPGNVFLTDDHDGLFVRVLDFGISQGDGDLPAADRIVVGTPEYMSPEQAYGEPLDRRSDVYSVGVMMYEMLAGSLPYDHPDPMEVLQLVISGRRRPLVDLRPDQPDLCAVVDRAMERKVEDRYQTAREMQRAVMDAVGLEVTGRFAAVSRHPSSSGALHSREATTLDLESDPAGRSGSSNGAIRPPRMPTPAPSSLAPPAMPDTEPTVPLGLLTSPSAPYVLPSSRTPLLIAGAVLGLVVIAGIAWAATRSDPTASASDEIAPAAPIVPTVSADAVAAEAVEPAPVAATAPVVVEDVPAIAAPDEAVPATPTASGRPSSRGSRTRATHETSGAPTTEPTPAGPELTRELDF